MSIGMRGLMYGNTISMEATMSMVSIHSYTIIFYLNVGLFISISFHEKITFLEKTLYSHISYSPQVQQPSGASSDVSALKTLFSVLRLERRCAYFLHSATVSNCSHLPLVLSYITTKIVGLEILKFISKKGNYWDKFLIFTRLNIREHLIIAICNFHIWRGSEFEICNFHFS